MRVILVGVFVMSLVGCHEDETYYCYLVENDWPDGDTLGTYDEAFWFYKKRSKPEDECQVALANIIVANQADPSFFPHKYICDCGWEPD